MIAAIKTTTTKTINNSPIMTHQQQHKRMMMMMMMKKKSLYIQNFVVVATLVVVVIVQMYAIMTTTTVPLFLHCFVEGWTTTTTTTLTKNHGRGSVVFQHNVPSLRFGVPFSLQQQHHRHHQQQQQNSMIIISSSKTELNNPNRKQQRIMPLFMTLIEPESTSTTETTMTTTTVTTSIELGDVVTIECCMVPNFEVQSEPLFDGVVVAPTQETPTTKLEFVIGNGNYIPTLHDYLICTDPPLKIGETRSNILLQSGTGSINPNLIATISFAESGITREQIRMGSELQLQNGMNCRVTNISKDDTTFTIDANPISVGQNYTVTQLTLLHVHKGPIIQPNVYSEQDDNKDNESAKLSTTTSYLYDVATFALGCFWGGELEYMRVPGVVETKVGYTQGPPSTTTTTTTDKAPTYEQVCSGTTGYTEAIMVTYNSNIVSYRELCQIALNRLGSNKYLINQVGNDKGTQYRHGIYYHSPYQKQISTNIMKEEQEQAEGANKVVVTECLPATIFYNAESYHQQYLYHKGQSAKKNDLTTIRCYG